MSNKTIGRREFLKTMAFMAGAAVAGPQVIAALRQEALEVSAASDKISYADFLDAVACLEQQRVSGPYMMVLPPWMYAELMESWDQYLREEFGKQMVMGVEVMMLREISPGRAEYVNVETGKSLGIIIVYNDTIPEDEVCVEWTVITEDATLTIGVEAT